MKTLPLPVCAAAIDVRGSASPAPRRLIESVRVAMAAAALLLAGCASTGNAVQVSDARTVDAAGLVDIQSLVPDIALDIRYAGADNFVGQPVRGYHAPRCYLLRPAAQALQQVERALRAQGLRLLIFDCYRPVSAVQHFVEWAHNLTDQSTKAAFYPRLDKRALLGDYISPTSGHSRGATVDLTLQSCDQAGCRPLDMGTPFDFFDERAHTQSPLVTPEQRANRLRLRTAMEAAGFANYPLEWWHFTLRPEPTPRTAYDVPVR